MQLINSLRHLLPLAAILLSQSSAQEYPPADRQFISPTDDAERSPCPAINMLANHGFINRDGKNVPVSDLLAELEANFPVVPAIPMGAAGGARTRGLFDDDAGVEVLNLSRLHEPGPSGLEHQSSITREDQVAGDSTVGFMVSEELRVALLESNDSPVITREELMEYQVNRILEGRRETDSYSIEGVENTLASQATLLLAFGGNEDLDFAPKDIVQSIFFDEKVPDGGYNPALFSFRLDFSAEPGMSVRTMIRENIDVTLSQSLIPSCSGNFFLALQQFLLGWLSLFGRSRTYCVY